MQIIKDHITEYLRKLLGEADNGFADIYEMLKVPNKEQYRLLLMYIDKILNLSINDEHGVFKYSGIHIAGIDPDSIGVLAKYIAIKFYVRSINNRTSSLAPTNFLINKVKEYERMVTYRYRETPSYVSGKKISRKAKQWLKEKSKTENLFSFYRTVFEKYGANGSFSPKTIINVPNKDHKILEEAFKTQPFAIGIGEASNECSPVILNSEKSWKDIDGIKLPNDEYLFDLIEDIILIDCEGKKISRAFTYRELKEWNALGNLRNLILLTFSEGATGFYKLKLKLDKIESHYYSTPKYPTYNSYTIPEDELNILLDKQNVKLNKIEFFGDDRSTFWEEFKLDTEFYEGLYELRSLKLMNVYSLALSEELRTLILDDIFRFDQPSKIVTNDTKEDLKELSSDTVSKLRFNLSNTLTFISRSEWKNYLIEKIRASSTLIIPYDFINSPALLAALKTALGLTTSHRIRSWFDIDYSTEKTPIIVLDYRDTGRFPYGVKPNIFEASDAILPQIECYFIKFLFKEKFDWAFYRYHRDFAKILGNDFRDRLFDWPQLSSKIQGFRPVWEDRTIWDIENQFESNRSQSTIKVKFEDQGRIRSFNPPELFIVKIGERNKLSVSRLEDLLEDEFDEPIFIQMLDEIHSEFNIYEKIANHDREEKELKLIRDNYSLSKDEKAERLWKILLRQKGNSKTLEEFYSEVQSFLELKGVRLVSLSTFRDHWINPDSKSLIPKEKRLFYFLCEYLDLPKVYFSAMIRLKNMEVLNSKNNIKQMNALLRDLIDNGCFNAGAEVGDVLLKIKDELLDKHDFDGIGFYSDTLIEDLKTLVELLKPYLNLKQVQKIELN